MREAKQHAKNEAIKQKTTRHQSPSSVVSLCKIHPEIIYPHDELFESSYEELIKSQSIEDVKKEIQTFMETFIKTLPKSVDPESTQPIKIYP